MQKPARVGMGIADISEKTFTNVFVFSALKSSQHFSPAKSKATVDVQAYECMPS